MARSCLTLRILLIVVCFQVAAAADAAVPRATGILLDLEITDTVEGDAVVFGGDLVLRPGSLVLGDAVAVGGTVRVESGASLRGHAVAVFGGLEAEPGADIQGRTLAFASVASLSRVPLERGSSLRVDTGLRLVASGGWLLVTTGLAFLFPARMRFGAWTLPALGFKVPVLGILVALTFATSLVAVFGLGPTLGVPLAAALVVLFFAAKCAGLTVVGCAVGSAALGRVLHHPLPISLEVFVGVVILLALRFLPWAGETLWTVIALLALGAGVVLLGIVPGPRRPGPA